MHLRFTLCHDVWLLLCCPAGAAEHLLLCSWTYWLEQLRGAGCRQQAADCDDCISLTLCSIQLLQLLVQDVTCFARMCIRILGPTSCLSVTHKLFVSRLCTFSSRLKIDCSVKVGHTAIDLIVVPIVAERRCYIAAEGSRLVDGQFDQSLAELDLDLQQGTKHAVAAY